MIEIMLMANLVWWERVSAMSYYGQVFADLFEEYQAWIIHDRLTVRIQWLMLTKMAMYSRCCCQCQKCRGVATYLLAHCRAQHVIEIA